MVATIRSSGRSPPPHQLLLQLPLPLRRRLLRLRLSHHPPRKAPHHPSSRLRTTPLPATAKTNGDRKRMTMMIVPRTNSTRRATHATDSRANCSVLSSPQQVPRRALNPPPRGQG